MTKYDGAVPMDPRVQEYLDREYPILLHVDKTIDGEQYAVGLRDIPGCIAQGSTIDEARQRLETIKPEYFARMLELGTDIPEPTRFPPIIPGLVGVYDERTGMAFPSFEAHLTGEFKTHEKVVTI